MVCPSANDQRAGRDAAVVGAGDRRAAQRERHGHGCADLAHRVVAGVGDVEVAGGVEGQAAGSLNPEAKVLTTPAGVTLLTVPLPSLAT